jgi:hypothetical protein
MHGCGEETITLMTQGGRWIAAMQRHLQRKGGTTRRSAHKRRRAAARRRGFWDSRQGLRFLQKKGTRDEARLTDNDERQFMRDTTADGVALGYAPINTGSSRKKRGSDTCCSPRAWRRSR